MQNAKRALHCGTPMMTRDAELEQMAQRYADTCPRGHASDSQRTHPTTGRVAGENMQGQGGSSYHYDRILSFRDAVNMYAASTHRPAFLPALECTSSHTHLQ
jgi:hypothetical protein